MKKFQRIFAALLVLVLAFAMVPAVAQAAELEEYVIADTRLKLGSNTLTLDSSAVTTVFEFYPTEAGVYTFTADSSKALVGYWGAGTFFVFDQTENKTNVLTYELSNVGPSIMVGISGVSSVKLNVVKTGEATPPPQTITTNYTNTHSFTDFAVGEDAELVDINVTDSVKDTVVLGEDGFYHLNNANGPMVLMKLSDAPIDIAAAADLHQICVSVKGKDGNFYKTDYSDAIMEYLNQGLYPVTAELAKMVQEVGVAKNWWQENGFVFGEGKKPLDVDTAWLAFACYVESETCASYDKKVVTYPTLTSNGYTTFICNVCGDSYVKNYTFPDVPSTLWSYASVEFAVAKGFFTGYKSGNFGPTDNITRQDFVVVLARIAKVDLSKYTGRTKFSDVKPGDYYESAVKWASSNGIVNGYNNGKFGVGDKITREQMVTILYNYAKKMGYDTSVSSNAAAKLNAFKDAGKVSSYAKPAVIWALNKGIISGMNETTVGPQESASRGQTATILMNISKKGIMPI